MDRRIKLPVEKAEQIHAEEMPVLFGYAQKAIDNFFPGGKAALVDGNIQFDCIGIFDGNIQFDCVGLCPVIFESKRIGAIEEKAGWQVFIEEYTPETRWEPGCHSLIEVGEPNLWQNVLPLFLKTVFDVKLKEYFDRESEDQLAKFHLEDPGFF